ncbi:MAG TPA: response regulator transcription factor [Polyangiaceae bacterium]|jgi:two-component system OmpR family response regulator|nr:response regulator transcription factor [Polyangiaceae bacterium]
MSAVKHILVVDDERRIREVVEYALAKEGYRVTSTAEGAEALAAFERDPPDLVVLDVMLPGIDGLELCRRMRRSASTPILFLSARSDEVDRIVGLEVGGDDYLVKPFSPRELLARVRAVLRRFQAAEERNEPPSRVLRHGRLELDPERFEARFAGTPVALTSTEFALLSALLERPGSVLSRAQLMQRAYSGETVTERTLDTHVRRIRAKFRIFSADPIATVHGVGYKAGEP